LPLHFKKIELIGVNDPKQTLPVLKPKVPRFDLQLFYGEAKICKCAAEKTLIGTYIIEAVPYPVVGKAAHAHRAPGYVTRCESLMFRGEIRSKP
jgi:hypothetical protein